jgi:hypothetical protein
VIKTTVIDVYGILEEEPKPIFNIIIGFIYGYCKQEMPRMQKAPERPD